MFEDSLDEDAMELEDTRLDDEVLNDILDKGADRHFLELIQSGVEIQKAIREVERQYWRDRSLNTIERGYEHDWHEVGFDDFEQPWLVHGLAIPLDVIDHYVKLIEESPLSDEMKRSLRDQLVGTDLNGVQQTQDFKKEEF